MNSFKVPKIPSPLPSQLSSQAIQNDSTNSLCTHAEDPQSLLAMPSVSHRDESFLMNRNGLDMNPSEIKTEDLRHNSDQEVKTKDDSTCDKPKCLMLQKKLSISRTWNRFYKENLINIDRVLHIITDYENEKRKHLELQLAYDQRSREWTQQQEQLIQLLNEIQPLREKLKKAEDLAAEEKKMRLKHQYVEESLKVTIQQLQAKVSQMQTFANPLFVENLGKKLTNSRSENKKIRVNLESCRAEISDLRNYISSNHNLIEKLSKKFFWALQLAHTFGRDLTEKTGTPEGCLIDWDTLQNELQEMKGSLKGHYDSFRRAKQEKLRGRKLELSCIPSFENWARDFDNEIVIEDTGGKEIESEGETRKEDVPGTSKGGKKTKGKEPSVFDIEDEGTQLEKLLTEENEVQILETPAKDNSPPKTKEKGKKLPPPQLPLPSPQSQKSGKGRGRPQKAKTGFTDDSQSESVCSGGEATMSPLKSKRRNQSSSNETDSPTSQSLHTRRRRQRISKKTSETPPKNSPEQSSRELDSSALFSAFLKKKMEMTPLTASSKKRMKHSNPSPERLPQTVEKPGPGPSLPNQRRGRGRGRGIRALSNASLLSDTSSSESDSELDKMDVINIEGINSAKSTLPVSEKIADQDRQMDLPTYSSTFRVAQDKQKIQSILNEMRISPMGSLSPYSEEQEFPSDSDSCAQNDSAIPGKKRGRPLKIKSEIKPVVKPEPRPVSDASLFVPPRVTRYSLRRQSLSENTPSDAKNDKCFSIQREFEPTRKKKRSFCLSDTESNSSRDEFPVVSQASSSASLAPTTISTVSEISHKDNTEVIQSCPNSPLKSGLGTPTKMKPPDFLTTHHLLRSDLSISSSNTDTEEIETSSLNNDNPENEAILLTSQENDKIIPEIISQKSEKSFDYTEETEEVENCDNNSYTPSPDLKFDMPLLASHTAIIDPVNEDVDEEPSKGILSLKLERVSSPVVFNGDYEPQLENQEECDDTEAMNESLHETENSANCEVNDKSLVFASHVKKESLISKSKISNLFSDESFTESSPIGNGKASRFSASPSPNSLTISSSEEDENIPQIEEEEEDGRVRHDSNSSSPTVEDESALVIEWNDFSNPDLEPQPFVRTSPSLSPPNTPPESEQKRRSPIVMDSYYSGILTGSSSTTAPSTAAPSVIPQPCPEFASADEPCNSTNNGSWVPSFYKERGSNSPLEEGPQVLEGIFEDSSDLKGMMELADEENTETEVSGITETPKHFPLVRTYCFEGEEAQILEKEVVDSSILEELFQDIIGTRCGTTEWKSLIHRIINNVSNIKAPNILSKQQPLIRVVLLSILRSSAYEKRELTFAIPPTMYKLFQIVRIIECSQTLPSYSLDTLVNVAAHKLILTTNLRPSSLATLTTWFVTSCTMQYSALEPPHDEDKVHWMRSFIIDLLFHHKGLVHEALLAALTSSKKIFIKVLRSRNSTIVEKMIAWIVFHGEWSGPKATQKQLTTDFRLKLQYHKTPPQYPGEILNSILEDITAAQIDPDKLAATKTGFYLLLRWVPIYWTTSKLFPLLKTVFYDESQAKLELQSVKNLLASMVQEAKWPEKEEKKFMNFLTIFPIVK